VNKRVVKVIIGSILGVLYAASANANLIVNGGFEEATGTEIGGGGGWKYYNATVVPGWEGSNIELWETLGVKSYEGDYHAELNAHGQIEGADPWSISQTFATTVGQAYNLFFAYGARLSNGNGNESDEAFNVKVIGLEGMLDFNLTDHVVNDWTTYSGSFVANSDFSTLSFSSVAQSKWTYGNFLDNIVVVHCSLFKF